MRLALIIMIMRRRGPKWALQSEQIGHRSLLRSVTLAGVQYQNVGVMLFGTVVGGTGFGTVFSGTLRSVLPYAQPGERAGLLSAYFVVGYLSFSLPALAAGFLAPVVGLTRTADFYGIGVILLAITSLAITLFRGRRVAMP